MNEKEVNQKTVLVVDDEPDSLELIGFILKRANYHTVLTSDPQGALSLIEKESPDLVILDLLMPAVNGLELCRFIKQHPTIQKIPVLFLSAMVAEKEIEAGLRAGAAGFIFKPYESEQILKKISEILAVSREVKSR